MQQSKNSEILEYLMTSDFTEDLSKEELIVLLKKFREFYRILHSTKNNQIKDLEFELNKMETEKNRLNDLSISNEKDLVDFKNEYNLLFQRKLSLSERISGKINDNLSNK